MSTLHELLKNLIAFPSLTPDDAGCQTYLIAELEKLQFTCQRFDSHPVSNFFARIGDEAPLIVFAGHTDVVPTGDPTLWLSPPFELTERDGFYFGRGVADMKGGIAAFMGACQRLVRLKSQWRGSMGLLITSAEEGGFYQQGTPFVMNELLKKSIKPDFCIVGEPSCETKLGDVIKIGRRGSLNTQIHIEGKQGHVAYPHLADNPIHRLAPALAELVTIKWDDGNEYFPPSSLQISHLHASGQASNVIPGSLDLNFNIRFSSEHSMESLKEEIHAWSKRHQLKATIQFDESALPFLSQKGPLIDTTCQVIESHLGIVPQLRTDGGTSDARFIAPYGIEVLELGPNNRSIHQINECLSVAELDELSELYYQILRKLLSV